MEFDTFEMKQSKSDDYRSKSGSMYLDEYEYRVDKEGVKKLVKTDKKTNVYERIQADYDSTDINKLMLRFSLGDTSAINVREGKYIDVTEMPTTLAELFDKAVQAEQLFTELPVDLKEMFNNSPSEFFAAYGSKEFDEKIAKYNDRFVNHQFDDSDIKADPAPNNSGEYVEVDR